VPPQFGIDEHTGISYQEFKKYRNSMAARVWEQAVFDH
jgi:hypothetical protein